MRRGSTAPPLSGEDEELLTRMRDLSLVDIDALLAGTEGAQYARLLVAYADDLEDALRAARDRMAELVRTVAGADPLVLLDAPFQARARDGGRDAADRSSRRLVGRSHAARALARIDDLAAGLVPRLLEADRRRASVVGR